MPSVPVLDDKGKAEQAVELSADVFGGTPRIPLLHQAVVKELAARRAGTHSTRGRSDVSGGGRKPWKQKGTGRARQGSIRATQWKGGGKPFGPRPRKYDKQMPAAMRRAALREAVAAKLAAGEVAVMDALGVTEPKTKALTARLKALGLDGQPTLLVLSEVTDGLARAARNVPWLAVETPTHASVYQVLRHERVVFERAALQTLEAALRESAARAAPAETAASTPSQESGDKPNARDRKTSVRRGGSAGARLASGSREAR